MQSVQGPPYRPFPSPPVETRLWKPKPRTAAARPIELLAAVGLVAAVDFAFWSGITNGRVGYGTAVFFLVVPAIVIGASQARRSSARALAIIAMIAAVAVRCAFQPSLGSVVVGLGAVFALALALREPGTWLGSIGRSFVATAITTRRRYRSFGVGLRRTLGGGGTILGIAIPVGLVTVFVGLFALANPLVSHWLGEFGRRLAFPSILRLTIWGVGLGGAILLLRPAVRRSRSSVFVAEDGAAATAGVISISRNALLAVNVLFFFYNALDATYLWAGSPPPGVSERAYAHQGAAWLTVTMLVLTGVVGFMFRGPLAWDTRGRLARGLAFVWLGQGLVLALATYRRMMIHVVTSGLSNLRILGIFGTTLVVVGLVTVGAKLARRASFGWLLKRQFEALVAATLVFSLLPTHFLAAHANIGPVMRHDYQALVHVEEQAREAESAATLLPLIHHDDERIRRGMAALLLNEHDALQLAANGSWRTHSLAGDLALGRLENARPELESVLGDVDREDAIRQFEYIRNSAIEGEIAQSEINRVEYAPTRSEKALKEWAANNGYTLTSSPIVEVRGNHATSHIHYMRSGVASEAAVSLTRFGAMWIVDSP